MTEYKIRIEQASNKHDARRKAWAIVNETFKDPNIHYDGTEQTGERTYIVSFVRFDA
jgi:hypothetical protein